MEKGRGRERERKWVEGGWDATSRSLPTDAGLGGGKQVGGERGHRTAPDGTAAGGILNSRASGGGEWRGGPERPLHCQHISGPSGRATPPPSAGGDVPFGGSRPPQRRAGGSGGFFCCAGRVRRRGDHRMYFLAIPHFTVPHPPPTLFARRGKGKNGRSAGGQSGARAPSSFHQLPPPPTGAAGGRSAPRPLECPFRKGSDLVNNSVDLEQT